MADLTGKAALVCGSTQGIGRACAVELADRGAAVTLAARDAARLAEVQAALDTRSGQRHHCICVDFGEPALLRQAVETHLLQHGPVHILVNNTGGPPSGPLVEADPQAFERAFANHVICNHLLVQAALAGMKASGYGRIINIISTSVKQPIPGLGVSNTIRAAVANWAKTLAGELAPFGITVNNVLPGYTDTARLGSLIQTKARRSGASEDSVRQEMIAQIPMGRLGRPDEIAAAVGFLASPAASYVSGINLPVDGGRTNCL